MKTTFIVRYGNGGEQRCLDVRALADFIHNLCISYENPVKITVEIERETR